MARRTRRVSAVATLTALVTGLVFALPGPASAEGTLTDGGDYCRGQCDDILPPGENGNATLADILANRAFGTHPKHTDDQLKKYGDLVNNYAGLSDDKLGAFFNDSSFGVPPDQVDSTIQPRGDVTIVRDKTSGVPHVYGTTRGGTEFGAGYAAAQDRLWLMDVFRHLGRGELTGFAGGAQSNRELEQDFWKQAPYTETDLRAQVDRMANSGPRGQQAMRDVTDFLNGLNSYIDQSHRGRYFPGEYDLTGHIDPITNAGRIEPFTPTDLVAIAGVIGGLFGTGGGGEVQSALVKRAAEAKYGVRQGDRVWESFREQNDPEAVRTLHDGQRFPYAGSSAQPQGVALPDPGSVSPQQEIFDPKGSATTGEKAPAVPQAPTPHGGPPDARAATGVFNNGVLPSDLLRKKHGMSNALVVSGRYTDNGHPVAVFGPQTGYYAPQLLMLEELQGPGISARGASFAGLNMYVQLGRGQDYSWSATSAGQDVTDTYAVPLCDPEGRPARPDSLYYEYHGDCLPMERLEKDNSWSRTVADQTPPGSYRMVTYRTKYGLVRQRGTMNGQPVAFASLRSSYQHEADSLIGFQEFNDPNAVRSAQDFQRAANDINFTFNWFYVDSRDTAYFNSGTNPRRPRNVDPSLPIQAQPQYEWQGWDPDTNTANYTPAREHPNSINQDYYVSWNNKQASDYSSAGFGNGSLHRVNLLNDRVTSLIHSGRRVSRASLAQAMADASAADLRGEDVLPNLLRVIGSQPVNDPRLAEIVQQLRDWQQSGALRKESKPGSHGYAQERTIQTMDAWWPLLLQREFQPDMGDELFNAMRDTFQPDDSPSGQSGQDPNSGSTNASESQPHKGSSFQYGWWSYVDKDVRAVLGDRVNGGLARPFCGGGDLAQCRQVLLDTLRQAASTPADTVYPGDSDCEAGDQWCADAIIQRPLGGVTDSKISWQNRPTYQQIVQYPAHRV